MIGTFQSLVKLDPEFFDEVEAVFVDECLSPDSLVTMSNGELKRIDEIKEGDIVLTVNNVTGEKQERPVDFVYKNLSEGSPLYEIETHCGKILKVTGNHKLRLKTGEWKKVEDLSENDELWDI